MALSSCDHLAEEEYIDMDMDNGNTTAFIRYTIASPPHSKEFEFHLSANPTEREATTSPADELFYKGKLLPLHLPPRLQMVEKLLDNSKHADGFGEEVVSAPIATRTSRSTPSESCNISPASSCCVSGVLNAEDHFACSAGQVVGNQKKSCWCKKLKFIKQSSLCLKLKTSQAYLKSLFITSRCSNEFSDSYMKAAKANPFGQIQTGRCVLEDTNATSLRSIDREKLMEEELVHRKSFSGAITWNLTTKSSSSAASSCSSSLSSSFSSSSSYGLYQPQMLKRSSSVNSEMESSILGAIAYCKESQQVISGRKSADDVGFNSLSTSGIAAEACESEESPRLCRG